MSFFIIDLIIIIVFSIAAFVGYGRSYRVSIINLISQMISICLSGTLAWLLMKQLIKYTPPQLSIASFISADSVYLIEPYEDKIIPFILFSFLFVILFVIIKSTIYVFSINYEWDQYFFPSAKFNKVGDKLLSMGMSILNAYTYVVILVIIAAFPLVNLSKPYSLSQLLLKTNPYLAHIVDEFYQPYEQIQKQMELIQDEFNQIFRNNQIDLEELEVFMNQYPEQRLVIQAEVEKRLTLMANQSAYLSFFSDSPIDTQVMDEYLKMMTYYINSDILTLEIFNSYYKELIETQIYDNLIEDEVISEDALRTLINSGMLNDDNLKKLEEYITSD
ncbi:MAG: hypothetical protein K2G70_00785 [Turicibacter sp.]|nr:hypothetical protein [Turicibacter sp.]